MNQQDDSVTEGRVEVEPTAPSSCGERLRSARESLSLSVSDVAQRLKYAPRQVQALEEARYDVLPGLTFQRGFVRGYAKLVGLDPDELVAALETEVGRDNGPTTMQLQQISYAPAALPAHSEGTSAWPWILGMLLAVVGIGGYTLYHWEAPVTVARSAPAQQTSSADSNRTTSSTQVELPAPVVGTPGASSQGTPLPHMVVLSQGATTSGKAVDATPTGGGKLRLAFSGQSWVEIRQGNGDVVYTGTNGAGSEQWVDGQAPFDLVIGNAPAVKLYYMGAEVKLEPYTKVTVARLQLK